MQALLKIGANPAVDVGMTRLTGGREPRGGVIWSLGAFVGLEVAGCALRA